MATKALKTEPKTPELTARHPLQIPVTPEMELELVRILRSDYEAAKQAREKKDFGLTSKGDKIGHDEFIKSLTDLYNSRREPKTTPWKFCSNRSLRIATSILDTICARLTPSIVNQDLIRWFPGESKDKPKVERINKFMNWWIWVRSELQSFFEIYVKQTAGFGDSLTETTYEIDPIDTGNTIETPVTDEMGNQLMEQDGTPAVIKSRDIRLNEKTCSIVHPKMKVFLQEGSRDIHKEPVVIEEEMLYRDLEDGEAQGKFVNVQSVLKTLIPVEISSGTNLSDEEQEKIKNIKIRNVPVKVHKEYLNFDVDGDGFAEDIKIYVSLEHSLFLGGIAVKNLTKSGRRGLHFQKFDDRLDRPTENDGEGILEKVKELAEEIDAIFNQLTDANTLSILRPGFYDPMGNLSAAVMKLSPNKLTPVPDPSRNVYFPDMKVKIDQLILAIRLVLEFIERLTAASSYVLGKESETVGGSGTATRTNAIMQSADTRFEAPAKRLRRGASKILKQHLDILQLNIPPGLETRVLGEKGEQIFQAGELSAEGISGEFDCFLLPDPSQGSKQTERDLANMFYGILINNPLVGTDPAKIYKITADIIKSWDKDPEEFLGPQPEMDDIDSPEDENTLIVQGDFTRVRAQLPENHLLHIQKHMDLMKSPSLLKLPPHLQQEIMQVTQNHIMEHQQMLQMMIALSQKVTGGGGGPVNPGADQGDPSGADKTPEQSGMEQVAGPLGKSLDSKRKGESGTLAQGG